MDPVSLRPWLALIHVLTAFTFVLVHGVSGVVALRLRTERDPGRVRTLLELSTYSQGGAYAGLGVLLLAGIGAGIVGGWWTAGGGWLWASVAILVLVMVAMTVFGAAHLNALRQAVGLPTYGDQKKHREPAAPVSDAELAVLLASPRPILTAAIGFRGIGLITALMMLKPF